MSAPHLVTTRRTALGGALAGLATVAGCDDGPSLDELTSGTTTAPAQGADTDLVDQVNEQIMAALGSVTSIRQARPALRSRVRPFVDLHGEHLDALGFEGNRTIPSTHEAGAADLALLRRSEGRLERQLTDAAVAAESGALAGLLASMAAAVAQHLAVLP